MASRAGAAVHTIAKATPSTRRAASSVANDVASARPAQAATIEQVIPKLADLVPVEPPARLHGDLWNGNVLWGIEPTGPTGPGSASGKADAQPGTLGRLP